MGLMDKVKAQASQLADKAQEAGKVGQAKIETLQAKRRADSLLADLGRLNYLAKAGRPVADDQAKTDDIIEQLRQFEAEYGALDSTDAASED